MIDATRWSPVGVAMLEPNALAAVTEISDNTVLTAGPGSGKTELLAQRADFLLRTGACRFPRRILAISFKSDASHNLKARVRMRCGRELASRLDSHTFHAFAKRIIDRFRLVLSGPEALDRDYDIGTQRIPGRSITFDDLVPLATSIVVASTIARNAIRQTFSHVFLDEFQDCTAVQYQFISACFLGTTTRLTAVGDTKQRIMGWAGALEGIFDLFAKDFDARPLNLYQNFRSLPRLRRMQNAMVRKMDPAAALDDTELAGSDGEIVVHRYSDDEEEATALAHDLSALLAAENFAPSDIAVLVSKQQALYCLKLCAALRKMGVPFREEDANQNLASEPIARLIIDFLLVVSGTREPAAYQRLLSLAVFDRGLDVEGEYRARAQWYRLVSDVRKDILAARVTLSDRDHLMSVVRMLFRTLGRDAIVGLSSDYAHGQYLRQQVMQTVDRAHSLLVAESSPSKALASFSGDRALRIMSIHKSKGLEFDVVIVLGVENETFWSDADSERSAFFVAISRARRRLWLTTCALRPRPNGASDRWHAYRTEHEEFLGYARQYA